MAQNLRQLLKIQGGGLAQTSAEEAAKMSGRQAAPISPLETKVIGANAHSAKMAGTPAQKTSALRTTLQGQDDLSTRTRRAQVRSTATEGEAEALSKEGRLQQLGDLSSRVEQLAENALLTGAGQTQDVQLQAGGDEEAVALLERIRTDPNDVDAIKAFNNLMGRQNVAEMLNSNEIMNQFDVSIDPVTGEARLGGGGFDEVSGALATSVQDTITSGDLNFEEMGFQDINEVASLLGTDAESLQGMSIQGMVDQLNSQIQNEYSAVEDLQRRVSDPSLGATERAEARRTLREMGAVGIRSAEADVDVLAEEIAEANTVEFMGGEMQIEELLDNDFVSGLVLNYFQKPDFAEKLKQEEPQLVEFIKKHENLLLDSVANIDQGLADFSALQQENLSLAKTDIGKDIPDDIMQEWLPGFGEITTDQYQRNDMMNLLTDDTFSDNQKIDMMAGLDTLKNKGGTEFIRELGTLDRESILRLGLDNRNSDKFKAVEDYLDIAKQAAEINPADHQGVARILGGNDTGDVESSVSELKKKLRSGFFGDNPPKEYQELLNILPEGSSPESWDAADWENTANKLKDAYLPGGAKLSLRELVNQTPPNYTNNMEAVKSFAGQQNPIYTKVADAFVNDDRIDVQELRKINNSSDLSDLNKLYQNEVVKSKSDDTFEQEMVNSGKQKFIPRLEELSKIAGFSDIADIGVSFRSKSNIVSDRNYAHVSGLTDKLVQSLEDERATAKSRGDALTVKVLDRHISDLANNKSKLDTKYEDHKKTIEAANLKKNVNRLKKLAKQFGIPQMLETAGKIGGFISNPEKTTREELARWEADIAEQLSQAESTIGTEAARTEKKLRERLIEPSVDRLPGAKGLREIGRVGSDFGKDFAGAVSNMGTSIGSGVSSHAKKAGGSIANKTKRVFGL